MIVGRFLGMMLAVLAGVTATGCATTSMPGAAPAPPAAVRVDPSQIYSDALESP